MNPDYAEKYASTESSFWWSVARSNDIIRSLQKLKLNRSARVLVIGSASGYQLRRLDEIYDNITGGDIEFDLVQKGTSQSNHAVTQFDGAHLPFLNDSFDIIIASDVLEHIANDELALTDWHRVLKPNGHMLIYVPAWPFLFGKIDIASHHHRRYAADELGQKVAGAGMKILYRKPWNSLLLMPAAIIRVCHKLVFDSSNEEYMREASPTVNWILTRLIDLESRLFSFRRDPFGLSHVLLAQKSST